MKSLIYTLEDVKKSSDRKLFKVVSLFAGGGGSSTGYKLAGGDVLAINEFVPAAQKAYHTNYPDTYIFKQDVRSLTGRRILIKIGLEKGELDVLDGSPPCSSFSMAGSREKGWGKTKKYSDTVQRTDDLFFEFARILKEVQPKVFICENVAGLAYGGASSLLGNAQHSIFNNDDLTIYHSLVNAGYSVRYKIINARHFGVPQHRERLIFIGVRNDIQMKITYPERLYPFVSLSDAFVDLHNNENDLSECDITKHKVYERLCLLKEGETYEKGFLSKAHRNKVGATVTASAGNIGGRCNHHWENRKFTVKETIRICSFPDDYYLGDTYSNKIERLGRAIPPLMMKAVASHVYETILSKI